MSVFSEVQNLYSKTDKWMAGDNTYTPKQIIEEAVEVLADTDVKALQDLRDKCIVHINNWNENSPAEQVEESEDLIEELSGYLAEWLE